MLRRGNVNNSIVTKQWRFPINRILFDQNKYSATPCFIASSLVLSVHFVSVVLNLLSFKCICSLFSSKGGYHDIAFWGNSYHDVIWVDLSDTSILLVDLSGIKEWNLKSALTLSNEQQIAIAISTVWMIMKIPRVAMIIHFVL